jgi:hypothetical protein
MREQILEKVTLVMIAFLIVMPIANPVFSQEAQAPDLAIDDAKLQSFARVYVQFEKIRQAYLPRLKGAQNVGETDAIEKEARARIAETLKKEGLTPEAYSQIVKQLNIDEGLRAKAMQLIDEERKKS